jgi:L-ascorbate metabolism protein UlaG (beta-lactamase superfamily)
MKYFFIYILILFISLCGSGCLSSRYRAMLFSWRYGAIIFKENFINETPETKTKYIPKPKAWSNDQITITWIGHATVLINFYGKTILTDPVLVNRLSFIYLGGHKNLGIRRITDLPIRYQDLPPIDLVIISHAHQDHLDFASLKYFHRNVKIIIPRNEEDLVSARNFKKIISMDWGDTALVDGLHVKAFKVLHWGERVVSKGEKKKNRGYNGYLISYKGKSIVFGGDSGFKDEARGEDGNWLKKIGQDSVDICILPIGDYCDYFNASNHMSPEEAWNIFNQVHGKYIVPIHWRTFILTQVKLVPVMEPMERLRKTAGDQNNKIVIDRPGMTFIMP